MRLYSLEEVCTSTLTAEVLSSASWAPIDDEPSGGAVYATLAATALLSRAVVVDDHAGAPRRRRLNRPKLNPRMRWAAARVFLLGIQNADSSRGTASSRIYAPYIGLAPLARVICQPYAFASGWSTGDRVGAVRTGGHRTYQATGHSEANTSTTSSSIFGFCFGQIRTADLPTSSLAGRRW